MKKAYNYIPYLILILLINFSSAFSDETNIEIQGILCKSNLTDEECQQLVENHIPEHIINAIPTVKEMFRNGIREAEDQDTAFTGPNCFWGALAYHDEEIANNPRIYNHTGNNTLFSDHSFVELENQNATPQAGDLIIFEWHYDIRAVDEVNGRPVWRTAPGSEVLHAAIYLENNILFQKEDLYTEIFSLHSIDDELAVWQNYASQRSGIGKTRMNSAVQQKILRKSN